MTPAAPPGAAVWGCQPTAWLSGVRVTNKDMAHTGIRWNNILRAKRQGSNSCSGGRPPTMAHRPGPAADAGPRSACTCLVLQARDSAPSTSGTETAVGLAGGPMTHACKQNKEVHIKPRTERDTPGEVPSSATQCHGVRLEQPAHNCLSQQGSISLLRSRWSFLLHPPSSHPLHLGDSGFCES